MPDNTFTDEDFFDRLIYEDRVPLAVELLDDPMADVDILHDTKANEKLLRSMSVHEENDLVDPDNEMSDLQNEVRLLNHKVNLLMTILSDLVKQQLKLPETTHIKFNTRGIRFCVDPTDKLFPVGKLVRLSMYLNTTSTNPWRYRGAIYADDPSKRYCEPNRTRQVHCPKFKLVMSDKTGIPRLQHNVRHVTITL